MNRHEIEDMMRRHQSKGEHMKDDDDTLCYRSELEAAVKVEREACAQLTEQLGIEGYGTLAIAAAIRARSKE